MLSLCIQRRRKRRLSGGGAWGVGPLTFFYVHAMYNVQTRVLHSKINSSSSVTDLSAHFLQITASHYVIASQLLNGKG